MKAEIAETSFEAIVSVWIIQNFKYGALIKQRRVEEGMWKCGFNVGESQSIYGLLRKLIESVTKSLLNSDLSSAIHSE